MERILKHCIAPHGWHLPAMIAAVMIISCGALHARGMTAPAKTKPPGGNVGAWLGDGPIFGWDDPFGEGLWEHGWQEGGVGGIGGREWGEPIGSGTGGGTGGTGGGGGRIKDCLREIFTGDDLTTTTVEASCSCRLKFFKGTPPPPGSYVDGECERGSPENNDCTYKGDCCTGQVPYAEA